MNKVIEQVIDYEHSTAAQLFKIFTDPKKHAAIHGGLRASISSKEGERFSLLNGNLTGRNLLIVRNRMIVQSWRGNVWKKDDLDSIVILVFSNTDKGARIYLTHSCTPPQFKELWDDVYWTPIRVYLSTL